LIDCAVLKRKS